MKRKLKKSAGAVSLALGALVLAAPPASADNGRAEKRGHQETTFSVTIENVSDRFDYAASGAFANPDGSDTAGPAFPGSSYSFDVHAAPGERLSFATMLVQSNDWFISPLETGVSLYDADGVPLHGDITDQLYVVDAGTEADQPLGEGVDQAPRQSGPNTGAADPDNTVRVVESAPAIESLVNVSVESRGDGRFTVTIANVSADSVVPGPLAPGVFAVHQDEAPLFTLGAPDRGEGLEALAEDGGPGGLAEVLASRTGTATPLAPGVFSVGHRVAPLYRIGRPDKGRGLEALAEDGNASELAGFLANRPDESGVFSTPAGAEGPGPLLPGESYTFTFTARPGEKLNVASMFVQSNDWFFGPSDWGLDLFRRDQPLDGNVTSAFHLLDAGTEVDQVPAFGADQPLRQAGPDTGAADANDRVRVIADDVSDYINVTISPTN